MNAILEHFRSFSVTGEPLAKRVKGLLTKFLDSKSYGTSLELRRFGVGVEYTRGGKPEGFSILEECEDITDEELAKIL